VTAAVELDAAERELTAIATRVRLALYQQIAWAEARSAAPEAGDLIGDREARRAWAAADPRARELAAARGELEAALPAAAPRLSRLVELFGLDRREADVVSAALAAATAPALAGAFAAAGGRPLPTEALIAAAFDHGPRRVLTPDSPLARWELVRRIELGPGEPDGVAIDPAIADWFTGAYAIEAALVGVARPVAPVAPLPGWPLEAAAAQIAARWERDEAAGPVRVIVSAPAGTGRASFAAALARRIGLSLAAIDSDAIDDLAWPDAVRRAHRQGFLTQTAIAFTGEAAARRSWPRLPSPFPLGFVCVEPGAAVAPMPGAIDVPVELPPATAAEREQLWRALAPAAAAWPPGELAELARRYRATPADVADAARRGAATPAAAAALIRERDRDRLGELARRVDCPFSWSDLILPAPILETLHDFTYEGRARGELWEAAQLQRMFPHGRGLYLLLTGAPGTGKTMAAQVIARELGLNLYRISLATVVSKYVGETAKNLTRILARAEHMDAVLLFDEADALFGKRTEIKDAHDRYANTDTNHLLQAIEAYAGIAVLASNKRGNIDPAFTRRLRHVLELPRPDAAQRRLLWQRLTRELLGEIAAAPLARALEAAAAIDLTGAQIKYALLAALLVARRAGAPVAAAHLVRGVERELQKDGRSMSDRERELVVHAA
jgi:AAA+ superfamily predicted ATPase